jgi:hypothetical protein
LENRVEKLLKAVWVSLEEKTLSQFTLCKLARKRSMLLVEKSLDSKNSGLGGVFLPRSGK